MHLFAESSHDNNVGYNCSANKVEGHHLPWKHSDPNPDWDCRCFGTHMESLHWQLFSFPSCSRPLHPWGKKNECLEQEHTEEMCLPPRMPASELVAHWRLQQQFDYYGQMLGHSACRTNRYSMRLFIEMPCCTSTHLLISKSNFQKQAAHMGEVTFLSCSKNLCSPHYRLCVGGKNHPLLIIKIWLLLIGIHWHYVYHTSCQRSLMPIS